MFKESFKQGVLHRLFQKQYFDLDPTVDVVVFGHTYNPAYKVYDGFDKPKIVVNEGTWIDSNSEDLKILQLLL